MNAKGRVCLIERCSTQWPPPPTMKTAGAFFWVDPREVGLVARHVRQGVWNPNRERSPSSKSPAMRTEIDLFEVGSPAAPQGVGPLALRRRLAIPIDRSFERDEIRRRVADFKATQNKFQQGREEYYKATIAKVRSNSAQPAMSSSQNSAGTPPKSTSGPRNMRISQFPIEASEIDASSSRIAKSLTKAFAILNSVSELSDVSHDVSSLKLGEEGSALCDHPAEPRSGAE